MFINVTKEYWVMRNASRILYANLSKFQNLKFLKFLVKSKNPSNLFKSQNVGTHVKIIRL